jgi:NAD(P) transhydrogenase subunit alpha
MKIAIPAEIESEMRVAATPDTVKKMKALGAEIAVEQGAGVKSGMLDVDFTAAGATVRTNAVSDADVVLKVRRPANGEVAAYRRGALVIAIMDLRQ